MKRKSNITSKLKNEICVPNEYIRPFGDIAEDDTLFIEEEKIMKDISQSECLEAINEELKNEVMMLKGRIDALKLYVHTLEFRNAVKKSDILQKIDNIINGD